MTILQIKHNIQSTNNNNNNNNSSLYWNQVDNRNLLQWHTKQAATQDSTALYNRTQSFGTQAFKSTKYNTSLARSFRLQLSAMCPQCRNLINMYSRCLRPCTIVGNQPCLEDGLGRVYSHLLAAGMEIPVYLYGEEEVGWSLVWKC